MLVRAWKHGAGSEGEGGRHGLHKRDDACGMFSVETSAGAEVVKCDQEARQNLLCAMLDTGTQFKVLDHRLTYHRVKARGKGPGTCEIVQKVQASRRVSEQRRWR